MSLIMNMVKNVVIYLILITVVMNLMGNSSYKKYIGIFTGIILIVIVTSPLLHILNLNEDLDYYLDIHQFSVDTRELNTELTVVAEGQREMVLEEYKRTLEYQVEKLLSNMDLILLEFHADIQGNTEEKDYGTIRQMEIMAERGTKEESKKINIDKITIKDINSSGQEKKEEKISSQQGEESVLASLVKQEVANLYELEENQIIVEIREQ